MATPAFWCWGLSDCLRWQGVNWVLWAESNMHLVLSCPVPFLMFRCQAFCSVAGAWGPWEMFPVSFPFSFVQEFVLIVLSTHQPRRAVYEPAVAKRVCQSARLWTRSLLYLFKWPWLCNSRWNSLSSPMLTSMHAKKADPAELSLACLSVVVRHSYPSHHHIITTMITMKYRQLGSLEATLNGHLCPFLSMSQHRSDLNRSLFKQRGKALPNCCGDVEMFEETNVPLTKLKTMAFPWPI